MDKNQLLLERNAESVTNLILLRRLFAEFATMQERGWIREQERIAQLELRTVRGQAPDTGINPDVIEIASGMISSILAGIPDRRGRRQPGT